MHDKVMVLQREWMEKTLGAYYPLVQQVMYAKPDELPQALKKMSLSINTEQLQAFTVKHLGVRIFRLSYKEGRDSEDIIPFVDGRCVQEDDGTSHWCVVSQDKDC